jgi:hypothetical protein
MGVGSCRVAIPRGGGFQAGNGRTRGVNGDVESLRFTTEDTEITEKRDEKIHC